MPSATTNFAEIRSLIADSLSLPARNKSSSRYRLKAKTVGSLGRLEELAHWVAVCQDRNPPKIDRARVAVFAGNHGVVSENIAPYPWAATSEMVHNFQDGTAAITQICQIQDAELRVYEMALETPTHNFIQAPAMDEETCATAIAYGMMAVEEGIDCICLGEVGVGNDTAAAALAMALYGGKAKDWCWSETPLKPNLTSIENLSKNPSERAQQLADIQAKKIQIVAQAVAQHRDKMTDGLEIMRHLGGVELAAIIGSIIAARMAGIPVILDGFATTVAAACLHHDNPSMLAHCRIGHLSGEPPHGRLAQNLTQTPLLDFGMQHGEATGAALALSIVKSAVASFAVMGDNCETPALTAQ